MDRTSEIGTINRPARRRAPGRASMLGWIGALVFTAAFISTANGQSVITGTITGTVVDPNGAVIVGAQVQVVSETTGFVTPATSNEAGLYTARFLNPDTYDVEITAKGFAPKKETGVELLPTAIKEVDFKLSIGAVNALDSGNSQPGNVAVRHCERRNESHVGRSSKTPQISATTHTCWQHAYPATIATKPRGLRCQPGFPSRTRSRDSSMDLGVRRSASTVPPISAAQAPDSIHRRAPCRS